MIKVELLKKNDEKELIEFIESVDNVLTQHLLEWRNAILEMNTDYDMYLVARNSDNEIIGYMPAFFYKNKLGNIIQSNPYPASYGGIITKLHGKEKEIVFKEIISELIKIAKEKDCIITTIFTSPFREEDYFLYKKYFSPDYEKEKIYQYIDLKNLTLEEFLNNIKRDIKRNVKKAKKLGIIVENSSKIEEISNWHKEILTKRMQEIDGNILPLEWFNSIWKNIILRNKGEFITLKKEDSLIGGGIFIYNKYVMDDYFSVVSTDFLKTGASTYLAYNAIIKAFEKKIKYFNWQSSPNMEGVYEYKRRWGSLEGKHWYLVKVLYDIKDILKVPLIEIKEAYKWHFILPYELFG